ncbi:hypothetical protein H1D32_11815 [Anaerobacillus sp. CMMVII]|uniref:DUF6232 family protein n=1 Tax=Anaerobacillus sp. CMMVII TaxID=2755588 RepID=UPI0021B7FD5B|nr:DUF6232 family protein [Anaerobacillus sp. CMMVII]MCT8138377.1 hypothetical protein [Anaerobacillus sp. CMMVII]
MSEIIYYKSENGRIAVADDYIRISHMKFKIDELTSGEALIGRPDQSINIALAVIGVFCILLGKIRAGQLSQIIDVNVLFSAVNYFDLTGLVIILLALLMTLPQKEHYAMQLRFKNGRKKNIVLKDFQDKLEISEINKAIKQAIRYATYRNETKL